MSHTVTIQVQVRDLPALIAACRRLVLGAPVPGEHALFAENVRGYAVQLKDWNYPVVFNLEEGKAAYDNYNGKWGQQKELDNLLQGYSVELAKSTMRRRGWSPIETLRPDGSILLTATAV
ncbi:MAG: hypothetical protein C0483_18560 [Pirellula sp.]|nr:hypothetical protein [Pirellula sp.]